MAKLICAKIQPIKYRPSVERAIDNRKLILISTANLRRQTAVKIQSGQRSVIRRRFSAAQFYPTMINPARVI